MTDLSDAFANKYINPLVQLYKSAYLEILKEQQNITVAKVVRNRAVLRQIEGIVKELDNETYNWLKKNLPDLYKKGMKVAVDGLKEANLDVKYSSFTQIHEKAVEYVVSTTYVDYARALEMVIKDSKRIVDETLKSNIQVELAKGAIKGNTREEVTKNVVKLIKDTGAVALKDKGSKTWQLDTYAEMLTRTKTIAAHNEGVKNRMIENGYDLCIVSDHFGSCPLCSPWEGKIYSLTGATKGYTMLSKAIENGLFHPNCRHTYYPYHTQLSFLDK